MVPRVVSFFVLLAVIIVFGSVFFKVMVPFVAPMFVAAVLVVVFKPLHVAIGSKLPGCPRLTAALTTALIALIVLAPSVWFGWRAYIDCRSTLAFLQDEAKRDAFVEALHHRGENVLMWLKTNLGVSLDAKALFEDGVKQAGPLLLSSAQAFVKLVIAAAIMMVSLYYFFADGPAMIQTLMQLSPLDDNYEQELLDKFAAVSRAVFVASILAAIVQGVLAGIGYYFALNSGAPIILLTVVTMVLALIPFVGAASVWIPTCLFILVYQVPEGAVAVQGQEPHGDMPNAIGLALYGGLVVSTIDNIIKPLVLHGQSNLHPLIALFSVLGGVAALGPIGILVGPMVVTFVHALLTMFNKELRLLGQRQRNEQGDPKV